ncbi:DUF3617 domain-containing protein [Erythrobacter litoralis]|uniref:DUF3617 domain-containing protein n=1 Tax=Erythrobacter litoralis (strain HTCC2594) TaxID=314225 RepID=Q2N8T1_ERYLH|nr:DUF3617 domain-containing protein [Erythrobacter litoralis]ABC63910.1 hypothetical protein ELI_09090 [Erythrobacter litoralis HTCC2594]
MRSIIVVGAALGLTLSACSDSSAPESVEDMADAAASMEKPEPGEYETTTELITFEVPGMGEQEAQMVRGMMEAGMTQATKYCLTEEEAEKGFEEAIREMQSGESKDDCTFERFDVSGNTIDSQMKCDDGAGNVGNIAMTGTVSPTTSDMTMEFDQTSEDIPGGSMKMKVNMKSRKIGECS